MDDKIAELLELAEEADRRSGDEKISEEVAWRLSAAHLRGQIVGIRWARQEVERVVKV